MATSSTGTRRRAPRSRRRPRPPSASRVITLVQVGVAGGIEARVTRLDAGGEQRAVDLELAGPAVLAAPPATSPGVETGVLDRLLHHSGEVAPRGGRAFADDAAVR